MIQRDVGRRILGCSYKTTSAAVRGELGWWTLSARRHFLVLKYWIGILLMKEYRLVKKVYNQSKREFFFKQKSNWVKDVYKLVQRYDLVSLWNNEDLVWDISREEKSLENVRKCWANIIFGKIGKVEREEWLKEVSSKPKLRTYKSFKAELKFESYLESVENIAGRHLLTAIRTGSNRDWEVD